MNMEDALTVLWKDLLGEPVPSEAQFRLWRATHSAEVLHESIIRTATKNLKLSGQMDFDYRIKFCSRVANDLTYKVQWREATARSTTVQKGVTA